MNSALSVELASLTVLGLRPETGSRDQGGKDGVERVPSAHLIPASLV